MNEWLKELTQLGAAGEGIRLQLVIPGLLSALLFSYLIAVIYKRVNRDRDEVRVMMHTLLLLAITIAAAMMIIGNNLARAFGLVGAVSIIRFRTAVKSSKDMAFVFLSIVIGMACGLGFWLLSLVFTLFVSIVLLGMEWLGFGQRKSNRRLFELRVKYGDPDSDRDRLEKILDKRTRGWEFVSMKTGKKSSTCVYHVEVENIDDLECLGEELKADRKKIGCTVTMTPLSRQV
jgi:uncharacterized membrane protein YhiD involved in acid resistance